MTKRLVSAGGALLLGAATLGIVWLLGMRNKQSTVVRMQRKVNRALFNPRQMTTAGTPGSYAAVVHHRGRRSGQQYRTPVGVATTDDGFAIGLVYGSQADWVQNLVAAGEGAITHEGTTYFVDQPRVVPFDSVAHAFSEDEQRSMRFINVGECLTLHSGPIAAGMATS